LSLLERKSGSPDDLGTGTSSLEHTTGGPGQITRLYVLDNDGEALAIEVTDLDGGSNLDTYAEVISQFSFQS